MCTSNASAKMLGKGRGTSTSSNEYPDVYENVVGEIMEFAWLAMNQTERDALRQRVIFVIRCLKPWRGTRAYIETLEEMIKFLSYNER